MISCTLSSHIFLLYFRYGLPVNFQAMLLQVFLSYKYNWCANLSETFFDIDLQELLYYSWDTEERPYISRRNLL